MDERYFGAVRLVGILTALQHTGIAALEAEGEDIERHVGTGLVDHADDTERHADAAEAQTVGQRLLLGDMTERGGEDRHVTHVGGDALQTTLRQLKTVVERVLLRHPGKVLGVGLEDSFLILDDGIGNGIQDVAALLVTQ